MTLSVGQEEAIERFQSMISESTLSQAGFKGFMKSYL